MSNETPLILNKLAYAAQTAVSIEKGWLKEEMTDNLKYFVDTSIGWYIVSHDSPGLSTLDVPQMKDCIKEDNRFLSLDIINGYLSGGELALLMVREPKEIYFGAFDRTTGTVVNLDTNFISSEHMFRDLVEVRLTGSKLTMGFEITPAENTDIPQKVLNLSEKRLMNLLGDVRSTNLEAFEAFAR